ncbi:hypothetical protein JCM3770_001375 [Rhodotorula araucariae]
MTRRSLTTFFAGVALLGARAAFAQTTIQSPALYQCTPASFQYTCASPPCTVVARPSSDATQALADVGTVDDASGAVSWRVAVPEGTQITVYITDKNGAVGNGAPTTVSGGPKSCLSGSSQGVDDSSSATGASSARSSTESTSSSGASAASSSLSSTASSVSSVASSRVFGAASTVASVASSIASSATGSAFPSSSASAGAKSGAASLAYNGALAFIAALAVVRLL